MRENSEFCFPEMAYGSSSTVCWELSCTRRVSPRSLRKTRRSQRRDSVSELPVSLRCLSLYLCVIAVALRRERAAGDPRWVREGALPPRVRPCMLGFN